MITSNIKQTNLKSYYSYIKDGWQDTAKHACIKHNYIFVDKQMFQPGKGLNGCGKVAKCRIRDSPITERL